MTMPGGCWPRSGSPVRALRRLAVGGLILDVGEGEARLLSDGEIRGELGFTARPGRE